MSQESGDDKISEPEATENPSECPTPADNVSVENPAAGDSKSIDPIPDSQSEIKSLHLKIEELETRCNHLHFENEKVNNDLSHERHKVVQLERQLQFVQDNQVMLEKIRSACLSCSKSNSASPSSVRKVVELRDNSCQTWAGILCRACLDTEKLRAELEQVVAFYDKCIIIRPEEMDKINDTIQLLKVYAGNTTVPMSESNDISSISTDSSDIIPIKSRNLVPVQQGDVPDNTCGDRLDALKKQLAEVRLRKKKLLQARPDLLQRCQSAERLLDNISNMNYCNNMARSHDYAMMERIDKFNGCKPSRSSVDVVSVRGFKKRS